ncbi:MAG: DUF5684 domain-containing protein [bacterium]
MQPILYPLTTILADAGNRDGSGGVSVSFGGILTIVGLYKVFEKAGRAGWTAIVPIYNIYIALNIINRPWFWLLLMCIPIVNIYFLFVASFDLAERFGKGKLFGIGMVLLAPFFYLILGFDSSEFRG